MKARLLTGVALLAAASACRSTEPALRVEVTAATALAASCYSVELRAPGADAVLGSVRFARVAGQTDYVVAVSQGSLPAELSVTAHAWVGKGCDGTLTHNGASEAVTAKFAPGAVREVALALVVPEGADVDEDGYLAAEPWDGADCDDGDAAAYPGGVEECSGGYDRNCDGRRGCADPTCPAATCAGEPTHFVFTSPEQSIAAAACSAPITVELRDARDRLARTATGLSLTATTSSAAVTLFGDAGCASEVTAIAVARHASGSSFTLRGTIPGAVLLSLSEPRLGSAQQNVTITEAVPSALAFLTPPRTQRAGECSSVVTLEVRDGLGAPARLRSPLAVSLRGPPDAGFTTWSDPGCAAARSTLLLDAGTMSVDLYFRGTLAGQFSLSADAGSFGAPSQLETIIAGNASALRFASAPQTLSAGTCSAEVTLQATDSFGNRAPVATVTTLNLSTVPDGGLRYFTDATCSAPLTQLDVAAGSAEATFAFQGPFGGTYRVVAGGLGSATQDEVITMPWPDGYGRRRPLVVSTGPNSPTDGYRGYTLTATYDSAGDVSAGYLRADGQDLHVLAWLDGGWEEIDRELSGVNTGATTVRFKSRVDIAPNSTDVTHWLYSAAPDAGPPRSDPDNVYLFRDDFEDGGLDRWSVVSGAWTIGTEHARSGTASLKYPSESTGYRVLLAEPPVDEADVLFEAYWYLDNVNTTDFSQFVRQQGDAGLNEYEVNLTSGNLCLAKELGGWSQLSCGGSGSSGTWLRIGLGIAGTRARVFLDGGTVVPTTGVGTDFARGNIGFRKNQMNQNIWIDDVTLRRFTEPEPTVTVGPSTPP